MIDNVKITLINFTGNLFNCKPIAETKFDYIYSLLSSEKEKASSLQVRRSKINGKVVISGSIRKWHFNKSSLLDLSKTTYTSSMKKLAKDLNIPFAELCQGKITQCEIGQNVRVSCPVSDIIPKLVGYSHLERVQIENETVYFRGKAKKLIIYDKIAEIASKGRNVQRKALGTLEEKGYHFLRLEFKLFNQKSFNQHDMKHIRTVGDLIVHFANLYEFWTNQINRLIVSVQIETDLKVMTQKEFLIKFGINDLGFIQFVEEYQSLLKPKTKDSLKVARSKAFKEVLDVLNKYGSKNEYGKNSLRIDVSKHLLRKGKLEEIYLPLLFKNLWGSEM